MIPFFILIGMAVPATTTLLEIYDNDEADMDVVVTGLPVEVEIRIPERRRRKRKLLFSNLRTAQE